MGLPLTYRDYEALPADGRRHELHEGELSATPAPSPRHQRISGNLNEVLRQHVKRRRLGEVLYAPIDCILSETTVVQPDLVYLDSSRLPAVSARGIEEPPTLVVEILSPSTTLVDRSTKRQLYARYGIPFYWIVDPEAHAVDLKPGTVPATHHPTAARSRRPTSRLRTSSVLAASAKSSR